MIWYLAATPFGILAGFSFTAALVQAVGAVIDMFRQRPAEASDGVMAMVIWLIVSGFSLTVVALLIRGTGPHL